MPAVSSDKSNTLDMCATEAYHHLVHFQRSINVLTASANVIFRKAPIAAHVKRHSDLHSPELVG